MARVTVEDCLEHVDNRFQLVLVASQRARQLNRGAEPTVDRENDKSTVIALREIAEGNVSEDTLKQAVKKESPEEADEAADAAETAAAAGEQETGESV